MSDENSDAYREKMARRKEKMDDRIAAADEDRGVLLVMTGPGKGKSSSSYGMLTRCLGHDMRCALIYFAKSRASGELLFFEKQPGIEVQQLGQGFTWNTQDKELDRKAAEEAWEVAEGYLRDPEIRMVVLDELCLPLKKENLRLEPVLAALQARPRDQHVVVTGRAAPQELIDIADTVSDIKLVKHAFRAGVRAQPGVER